MTSEYDLEVHHSDRPASEPAVAPVTRPPRRARRRARRAKGPALIAGDPNVSDEALGLAVRLAVALPVVELRALVERVEAGGGAMPLAAVLSSEELRAFVGLMEAHQRRHARGHTAAATAHVRGDA